MKLESWRIEPRGVEFVIAAENDAEVALLQFLDSQAATFNIDDEFKSCLIIAGHICQ